MRLQLGATIVMLLGAAACSESNADATKPGTTVLSWKLADSDRAPLKSAKLSEQKTTKLDYTTTVTPFEKDLVVKVAVELETATVVFEEDGKPVTHAAPVRLEIKATDAAGFTLSQGKCMGPNYDLALPPSRDMILFCVVNAKKPKYDVGFTIYAYGDGRIDDGKAKK